MATTEMNCLASGGGGIDLTQAPLYYGIRQLKHDDTITVTGNPSIVAGTMYYGSTVYLLGLYGINGYNVLDYNGTDHSSGIDSWFEISGSTITFKNPNLPTQTLNWFLIVY